MEQIREMTEYLREFNTVSVVLRLLLSVIAGGVIGSERGRHGRAAGFRTHILVSLGGAMTSLVSLFVFSIHGWEGDIFRIPASVVAGIGFLGAGMILVKRDSTVAGLTTAAGMWVTGTIGVAFGYGFYGGAILTTIICVVNAALLTRIEHKRMQPLHFYLEVNEIDKIQGVLAKIQTILGHDAYVESFSPKSGTAGNIGLEVTIEYRPNHEELMRALGEIDGVHFVVPG